MLFVELLNIARNSLTGPIPSMLGLMSSLEFLNLEGSGLTGSVPESFCVSREDRLADQTLVLECETTGLCSCCNVDLGDVSSVGVTCIENVPSDGRDDVRV